MERPIKFPQWTGNNSYIFLIFELVGLKSMQYLEKNTENCIFLFRGFLDVFVGLQGNQADQMYTSGRNYGKQIQPIARKPLYVYYGPICYRFGRYGICLDVVWGRFGRCIGCAQTKNLSHSSLPVSIGCCYQRYR